MKNRSKILLALVVLLFIFILATCGPGIGKQGTNTNDGTEGGSKAQSETSSASFEEAGSKEASSEDATSAEATESSETSATEESSEASSASEDDLSKFAIHGYRVGEIPAMPIVDVPVIATYSEKQQSVFDNMKNAFATINGLDVEPALFNNDKIVYMPFAGDAPTQIGDNPDITIQKNADGSGEFINLSEGKEISLKHNSDGSSEYIDKSGANNLDILRNSDGTGRYSDMGDDRNIVIEINGEYQAKYESKLADDTVVSYEYLDQNTANYSDKDIEVAIADGKAKVKVKATEEEYEVDALPLAPVPMIPELPGLDQMPDYDVKGFRVVLDDASLFDFDESELRPEGKEVVKQLVEQINGLGVEKIEIQGHTDSTSSDEYNQKLSKKRAASVEAFMKESGLKVAEVKAVGYGESKPIAPNTNADGSDNPAGMQANRRVEIFIPVE